MYVGMSEYMCEAKGILYLFFRKVYEVVCLVH